jgi:hypothetical protein
VSEIALHFICTPCLSHTNDGERPNSEPTILRSSLNEIPHALEWANYERTKSKRLKASFAFKPPAASKPEITTCIPRYAMSLDFDKDSEGGRRQHGDET